MKIYFYFVLILLLPHAVIAQSHKQEIDSLYQDIKERIGDNDLAYIEDGIDSLRLLAINDKDTLFQFLSRSLLAEVYTIQEKFKIAEDLLFTNKDLLESINPSTLKDSLMSNNYGSLASYYSRKEDYPKALNNYIEALKISKRNKDSISILNSYNGLGTVYIYQGLYDDALTQYKLSLDYTRSKYSKYQAYNNIGSVHFYKKEFKEAEMYYLKSLEYLNDNNKIDQLDSYNNLASVAYYNNHIDKALKYFFKSYNLALQTDSKKDIGLALLNLSSFFTLKGDSKKAIYYMNQCDSISDLIPSIGYKKDVYFNFYNNYKDLKDYKNALLYSEKHIKYKDSLFSIENLKDIEELRIKYETELHQSKITNQEQLIKSQKKQNAWLITGMFSLFGLLSLTLVLYRQKLHTQKKLNIEKLNTITASQEIKTIQSHLNGQNDERKRIAKDLHDSISGNLAAIKMKLTTIKSDSDKIKAIISNIDDTYNEVRDISHNLLPKESDEQNLIQRLNTLINLYNSKTLTVDFHAFPVHDINNIDPIRQAEILKILQELLTNISKHSKASEAIINITAHDNFINILVEDNGLGFDKNKVTSGIGLQNISSRVHTLHGTFDIDSGKKIGVTITINIPIL